jgi:hypothetical protein
MTDMNDAEQICMNGAWDPANRTPAPLNFEQEEIEATEIQMVVSTSKLSSA